MRIITFRMSSVHTRLLAHLELHLDGKEPNLLEQVEFGHQTVNWENGLIVSFFLSSSAAYTFNLVLRFKGH